MKFTHFQSGKKKLTKAEKDKLKQEEEERRLKEEGRSLLNIPD